MKRINNIVVNTVAALMADDLLHLDRSGNDCLNEIWEPLDSMISRGLASRIYWNSRFV